MNDENVITIEIRGHEPAAVAAAQRISELFLSSGPRRLRRTPGEVQVLVYADASRNAGEGGYLAPDPAGEADTVLR
uniref:4-oxalocrotonate tautomerase domain-containing protein n=1 Tax=Streptomyces sp. NBC_00049 TaxID=2903617 RepID=A0AAU2JIJ2_9ACTN